MSAGALASEPELHALVDAAPASAFHDAPSRRTLIAIALSAVLVRLLLLAAAAAMRHWGTAEIVKLRDAESYIHVAQALLGRATVLTAYDRRVFVGFPSLIAVVAVLRIPFLWAAMLVVWTSVGATAAAAATLFRSARVGWAMAVIVPSWLMYSSIPMTEAPLLALTTIGLMLAVRGNPVAAGLLLGGAGLVRPPACFAVLGLLAWSYRRREWRPGLVTAAISGAVVVAGFGAYQLWSGGVTQSVDAYDKEWHGQIVTWPFSSLLHSPAIVGAPAWKVVYVYAYVLLTLASIALLARRASTSVRAPLDDTATATRDLATLALVWAVGNTLFTLCIGHPWGFHEYHRYILAALPALVWGLVQYIPRRTPLLATLATGSFVLALFGLTHAA